jgi:hypothetical protein
MARRNTAASSRNARQSRNSLKQRYSRIHMTVNRCVISNNAGSRGRRRPCPSCRRSCLLPIPGSSRQRWPRCAGSLTHGPASGIVVNFEADHQRRSEFLGDITGQGPQIGAAVGWHASPYSWREGSLRPVRSQDLAVAGDSWLALEAAENIPKQGRQCQDR